MNLESLLNDPSRGVYAFYLVKVSEKSKSTKIHQLHSPSNGLSKYNNYCLYISVSPTVASQQLFVCIIGRKVRSEVVSVYYLFPFFPVTVLASLAPAAKS